MTGKRVLAALVLLLGLTGTYAARSLSQGQGQGNGQGNAGGGQGQGPAETPPGLAGLDGDGPPGREEQRHANSTIRAVNDPFDLKHAMKEDELIVIFKPGATQERKGNALGKGNAAEKQMLRRGDGASGDVVLVTVKINPGQSKRAQLKGAAARIKNDEDVEVAEPNFLYKTSQATPNDPLLSNLWGMLGSSAGGANAAGAWARGHTDCSGVVIGVIDTGIQTTHPDLKDNIWVNPGEIAGNGVDDDGNEYPDDINGWDFYSGVPGDASVYDNLDDDHGTHVAGTIGGVGNNGQGVVGVCQSGVKMISAKFLSVDGGYTSDAVRAVNYFLDLKKTRGINIVATSNSWGGGGFSQALYDAIQEHQKAGILFVAAAGNDAMNTDVSISYGYPASYNLANIISVGSATSAAGVSSFSNYGATTVDIFAPGSSIQSTVPFNTYKYMSGTSMATPHVTGAIALYYAAYKRSTGTYPTANQAKTAVMSTGVAKRAYKGKCVSGKQLNVADLLNTVPAVTAPSPSPAAPSPSPKPPSPSPAPPSPSPQPPSPSPTPPSPSPEPEPEVPSPSPYVEAPSPSPEPEPVTPSPSPEPEPELPSPSPYVAPPSPSPAPEDPPPPAVRKMHVVLWTDVFFSTDGWFYCDTSVSAVDADTRLPVDGLLTFRGRHSISPDVNWWTDYYAELPREVAGPFAGVGWTSTPWIPTQRKVKGWTGWKRNVGANFSGTQCTFEVLELTHADYTWEVTAGNPASITTAKY